MKKFIVFLLSILIISQTSSFSQNVGVGTATPDASAALDIQSAGKGLLIPRVNLLTTVDMTTIPSPATSLMIFNTNAALPGGAGYYFNSGTPSTPDWKSIGGFILPYSKTQSSITPLFSITNNGLGYAGEFISTNTGSAAALKVSTSSTATNSSAIHAMNGSSTLILSSPKKAILGESSSTGIGVAGLSRHGTGIYGESSTTTGVMGVSIPGTGVFGKSSSGFGGYFESDSGTALATNGRVFMLNTGAETGKILMVNSGGTAHWEGAIAFSAKYDSAYVPMPINTYITVPFNNEEFDVSNNFITKAAFINPNTFIAPVSGVYHFDGRIEVMGQRSALLATQYKINTTGQGFEFGLVDANYLVSNIFLSRTFKLNAGDKVSLQVKAIADDDCEISKAIFSGHLLFLQ